MYLAYSEAIETDRFLQGVAYYAKQFRRTNGFGTWIVEYQQMESMGQFTPEYLKKEYIKMLKGTCTLDFQRKQAVYECCIYAHEDANYWWNNVDNFEWQINVITGEIAVDDDGDLYIGLSYEEAQQIAESLNEEAEEELFTIKRMLDYELY